MTQLLNSRAEKLRFFSEKSKVDPEPKVEYWRDDKEWIAQNAYNNEACPDHGTKYTKTPDSLNIGKAVGCQHCALELMYPDNRQFQREMLTLLAKKGYKGNRIPKDWKAYKAHTEWEDRQAQYAEEFNERARLSEEDTNLVKLIAGMQKAGMIDVKPSR